MSRQVKVWVTVVIVLLVIGMLAVPVKRHWELRRAYRMMSQAQEGATEQEVLRVLGDPGADGISRQDDKYWMIYKSPQVERRFVYVVAFELDSKTHRVKKLDVGHP
jgi:hypothetical protein